MEINNENNENNNNNNNNNMLMFQITPQCIQFVAGSIGKSSHFKAAVEHQLVERIDALDTPVSLGGKPSPSRALLEIIVYFDEKYKHEAPELMAQWSIHRPVLESWAGLMRASPELAGEPTLSSAILCLTGPNLPRSRHEKALLALQAFPPDSVLHLLVYNPRWLTRMYSTVNSRVFNSRVASRNASAKDLEEELAATQASLASAHNELKDKNTTMAQMQALIDHYRNLLSSIVSNNRVEVTVNGHPMLGFTPFSPQQQQELEAAHVPLRKTNDPVFDVPDNIDLPTAETDPVAESFLTQVTASLSSYLPSSLPRLPGLAALPDPNAPHNELDELMNLAQPEVTGLPDQTGAMSVAEPLQQGPPQGAPPDGSDSSMFSTLTDRLNSSASTLSEMAADLFPTGLGGFNTMLF